jgi:FkbM family methyltransferase
MRELLQYPSLKRFVPAPLLLREMAWRYWMRGEREIRIVKQLTRFGADSIDVGAASGLYTYHLSRISRRVFAYEPNFEWVPWLRRAVPANVSVHGVALSNKSGTATLSIPFFPALRVTHHGLHRCAEAASVQKAFQGVKCDRIQVITRRLDEFDLDNIGFIKIDVEGHELAVLEGAERTLERWRPVLLIEIDRQHINCDVYDEFNSIERRDYKGWFLLEGMLRPLIEFDLSVHQPICAFNDRPPTYINNFIFQPLPPQN